MSEGRGMSCDCRRGYDCGSDGRRMFEQVPMLTFRVLLLCRLRRVCHIHVLEVPMSGTKGGTPGTRHGFSLASSARHAYLLLA